MRLTGAHWGAMALCLTGCLVPFPIEERPAAVNYPPFIIEGSVSPSATRVRAYDRRVDGQSVALRVGIVGDPNATDSLFARWFINFDPNAGFNGSTPVSLRPGETGPLDFTFDPCDHVDSLDGETFVAIDLLLSDRPFGDNPVGDEVSDEAGTDIVSWEFRFDASSCGSPQ